MSALTWDGTGEKYYEMGTDRGVLYVRDRDTGEYPTGVAWNGLTAVTESPDGAEVTDFYADNIKYGSIRSVETFGGTIEAYTYPDEWNECDGRANPVSGLNLGQQKRSRFGLSYRTMVGNDVVSALDEDAPYKIHLIYGASASPAELSYETINDSPDAMTMSWEFDTVAENCTGYKPVSCITIESDKFSSTKIAALEEILYGSDDADARLPLPDEVIELLTAEDEE